MRKIKDMLKELVKIIEPENFDLDRSRCEKVVCYARMLLRKVLEEGMSTCDLNDFVTTYMAFYYLMEETQIIEQLDSGIIDELDTSLMEIIDDELLIEYFGCLRSCGKFNIDNLHKSADEMNKAIGLVGKYELPYYYLTLIEQKKNKTDINLLMRWFEKSGRLGEFLYNGLESEALPNLKYENVDFYGEYTYVFELREKNRLLELSEDKLRKQNNHIKQMEKEKEALINKHAHNWKHIVYPETVKKVAKEMYRRGETEVANTLFHAYNSQSLLQQDLNLLQLQYASTTEEFCMKFYKSIYGPKDRRGVGIVDVFQNALQIVLFRLIMEGVDKRFTTEEIKKSVFGTYHEVDIRESYVDKFIRAKHTETNIIEWFSNNFYKMNVVKAEAWNAVKLKPEGLAYTQMTEIFIDLIHNALNYGKKTQDGYIDLIFDYEVINDTNMYTCEIKNPIDMTYTLFEGSGQGLESINEVIRRLTNFYEETDSFQFTKNSVSGDEFSYLFRLPENIISRKR